ncbi:hypothetical protein QYF36_005898 [Acer negundo]|nr:hypothetical protein QYF36_005898 [Acer negundo]
MRDQELFKNDQQWQKQSPTLDRSYMCSAMRRVVRERRISYRVGPALFRCLQFLWEPHHLKPLYPHNEKPSFTFSKASLHQRLSRMPSIDKESPEKNKRLFFHSIPVDAGEEVSATPVTESDLVESAGIGLAFKGSAAASSDLLVSAFLLVNGWAKAPSVSEKTTYFKVGPRPIDLFYGEGSEAKRGIGSSPFGRPGPSLASGLEDCDTKPLSEAESANGHIVCIVIQFGLRTGRKSFRLVSSQTQAFKSKKVAIRRKLPSFFLHRQRSDKKMLMPLTQIQDGKWLMTTLSRRTNSSQQVESRDPSSRLLSPARLFRDLSLRLDHRNLQLLAKPT